MGTEPDWKQRLYECYVTSGQAGYKQPASPAGYTADDASPVRSSARFVARHIPRDPDTKIIDLGCGHGNLLMFLRNAGYRNLAGVDVSAEQIAVAHRRGLGNAECGMIDDYLSKLRDSSVNVILLIDVLEHMKRSAMFRTLDAVYRVLCPGGKCIAHVPNGEGLYGMRVRYGDLTHEHALTATSASQLFLTVGFLEVKCDPDPPVVHGTRSFLRRVLWEAGTIPHRLLLASETGMLKGQILTQNMFIRAIK